jgi:hypothetical protein
VKTRKTKKLLDEASYYTGQSNGTQTPETVSAYEFSKDSVPTLNKINDLKSRSDKQLQPQELPFPLQDAVRELASLFLTAQDLRNKARDAEKLPAFKGKEQKVLEFKNKLNGIMVECKKLAASLQHFSLAPR